MCIHFPCKYVVFSFAFQHVQILLVNISLQCVCDGVCETGISFLFQFYMLVFVNLYMYIFVVREGLMED